MNTLRQATILGAAFFLLGVGLLVAAAFLVWQTSTFIHSSRAVSGRVVDLEWRESRGLRGGSSGGYVTVFTFTDSFGQAHTIRTKSAQNPPTHQVGAVVEVLFPPALPENARIRSFQTLWVAPAFLFSFGVAFTGVGGFAFLGARKTYRDLSHHQTA